MLVQLLVIALMFAEPAVAAPVASPAPAAAAAPPAAAPQPPTIEQVLAEIDARMAPWKDRSGERLRGMLGLSEGTRTASDGEVVFWLRKTEATACGIDAGQIRCGAIGGGQCRLGVAFAKDGKVRNWKATGDAGACAAFLSEIGAPG